MKLNKKLMAAGGLAAIAVIGGTWAYFNQTTAISNPLSTGTYTTSMVEKFTPSTDWEPGVKVDKLVQAENTGDYPVLVRVKMDEIWTRKGSTKAFAVIMSANAVKDENGKEISFFNDLRVEDSKYFANQYNIETRAFDEAAAKDGNVPAVAVADPKADFGDKDHSVVYKNLTGVAKNAWTFNVADGYWYYNTLLDAGTADKPTTSVALMDSITLAANVDMGKYTNGSALDYVVSESATRDGITEDWIISDPETPMTSLKDIYDGLSQEDKDAIDAKTSYLWSRSTSKIDDTLAGYANANYALNITTEFIQATKDAVDAEWTTAPDTIKALVK